MPTASGWSRLKRIGLVALAALFVPAAALFILPHFVSEQAARNAASRSLIAATGIVPRIEGGAHLSLFPRPAIRLEGVKLDHGEGATPGFSAGSVLATVRLLPLLTGEVEISSLTFQRPNFLIESRESGFVILGLPLRAPSGGGRDDVLPPELRIVDGHVEMRGLNPDRAEIFTGVDASFAWIGTGFAAAGTFNWHAVPMEMNLSIADTSQLNKGAPSGFRMRVDSKAGRAAFEGSMRVNNGVFAEGPLALDTSSLRGALALFGVVPLTEGGFGPLKLRAQASLTPSALTMTGLSLDLDGNRSEGGLTVKRESGRTLLQSTLASDSADFTPYFRGMQVRSESDGDWSRRYIDLYALNAFDLDLRLSSKRVTLGKVSAAPVAASLTLKGGQLGVAVGDAGIFGGKLRARAGIGPGPGGEPLLKFEANATDVDLERTLGEITGVRRVEGKAAIELAVEGSGPHAEAIVRNLSGRMGLNAVQGTLNGINVEQALRRIERRPFSNTPELGAGRTVFEKLSAKLRIDNGKASIEEAQMENSLLRVRMNGEASVVHRDLELRGRATLVRPVAQSSGTQPFDVPFIVQGSWTRPYLLPDYAAIYQKIHGPAPAAEPARKPPEPEAPPEATPAPPAMPDSTAAPSSETEQSASVPSSQERTNQ